MHHNPKLTIRWTFFQTCTLPRQSQKTLCSTRTPHHGILNNASSRIKKTMSSKINKQRIRSDRVERPVSVCFVWMSVKFPFLFSLLQCDHVPQQCPDVWGQTGVWLRAGSLCTAAAALYGGSSEGVGAVCVSASLQHMGPRCLGPTKARLLPGHFRGDPYAAVFIPYCSCLHNHHAMFGMARQD